ncbi:energy transducer TonB [Telmatospirillum sp.]|uniref:energy transducer TonB n=1 Tax=Telmatospirillum sp. TaxID=2079197 RepID=UPI0028503A8B|nr:energy transducer TonB [Telmatospirillum sp.]MDR3437956.1 energy transducer TonB [Telmatospirillum sp.]
MPVRRGGSAGKAGDLRLGLLCSVALHIVVLIIAVFGLPQLMEPPPEIGEPVIVEIAEIGDKTNPPPRQVEAPKPTPQPAEPPKQEAPPTPEPPKPPEPKPPEPKPEPPIPVPPPPPEPPKPVPPPPKPVEPEPEPIPVPTPKPKPPEPTPEPKPQPDPLKDIKPQPKKPAPPTKDDFDSLLKSVDKLRDTAKPSDSSNKSNPAPSPQPQQATGASSKTVNSSASDLSAQPTVSEKDYVSAQIWPKWNIDPGAKGADTLKILVRIKVAPDGTVTAAKLDVDSGRYAGDSFFRAAADAALRAVLAASPLKVPPTKPDLFKNNPDFTINFDPRSMAR